MWHRLLDQPEAHTFLLSRKLLQGGESAGLIRDFSVTGATSNPMIFANASALSHKPPIARLNRLNNLLGPYT